MGYTPEEIRDKLKDLTKGPIQAFWGKVKSVNEDENSCVVDPDDEGANLPGVLLKADLSATDGLVEIPVVGSRVICNIINNDEDTAFIAKTTEVAKVKFFGGQQKGLVLHDELKKVLDAQNKILDAFKKALDTPVAEPGNGAPSAFQAALKTALTLLEVPGTTNLENKKILQ